MFVYLRIFVYNYVNYILIWRKIAMEKYIISYENPCVTIAALLEELHMDKMDNCGSRVKKVIEMHREAVGIARPVALYSPVVPEKKDGAILLNSLRFGEPFVYKMLADHDTVVPYVASCGLEIDEWSKRYIGIFEQFIADVIKEMFLDDVRGKLLDEVREKHFRDSDSVSTINPGSLDEEWPISGQKPLFDLLGGVTCDIGVELTPSMMMIPTKSVSGVMFQTEKPFHNCQLCAREDCPGRAPGTAPAPLK